MARFCPSRGFILDLGGDGGLLFHFILSKIVANAQHASRVSCINLSQWGTKVLETVMQYSVIVRIFSMTSKRSAAVLEMSCSSPFSTHYNVACSKRSDVGVRHEVRERGKNRGGEGAREILLFVFPAHIFLRRPHNLNAWNRLNRIFKLRKNCGLYAFSIAES